MLTGLEAIPRRTSTALLLRESIEPLLLALKSPAWRNFHQQQGFAFEQDLVYCFEMFCMNGGA